MTLVCENNTSDRLIEQYVTEAIDQFRGTSLVQLTLDAVQAVDCSALEQTESTDGKTNPRTVLTLLAYCYTVGIYHPEQIVEGIDEDESIGYLAARTLPSQAVLRHFRRHHRALIREVLVRLYERVWVLRLRGAQVSELTSSEIGQAIIQDCTHPAILSRFGRLAEERILLALLWDGPALRD